MFGFVIAGYIICGPYNLNMRDHCTLNYYYRARQAGNKKSCTSRKRRQNEIAEINELAALFPLSTPLVTNASSAGSLVACGGKAPIISVLRLATSFLKLQNFMKDCE